jgi:hypothetical protein
MDVAPGTILLSFLAGYVCGISPSGGWLIRSASANLEPAAKKSMAHCCWTMLTMFNIFAVGVGTVVVIAHARYHGSADGTTSVANTIGVYSGVAFGFATFLFVLYRAGRVEPSKHG